MGWEERSAVQRTHPYQVAYVCTVSLDHIGEITSSGNLCSLNLDRMQKNELTYNHSFKT
jgi:hypothetical protein